MASLEDLVDAAKSTFIERKEAMNNTARRAGHVALAAGAGLALTFGLGYVLSSPVQASSNPQPDKTEQVDSTAVIEEAFYVPHCDDIVPDGPHQVFLPFVQNGASRSMQPQSEPVCYTESSRTFDIHMSNEPVEWSPEHFTIMGKDTDEPIPTDVAFEDNVVHLTAGIYDRTVQGEALISNGEEQWVTGEKLFTDNEAPRIAEFYFPTQAPHNTAVTGTLRVEEGSDFTSTVTLNDVIIYQGSASQVDMPLTMPPEDSAINVSVKDVEGNTSSDSLNVSGYNVLPEFSLSETMRIDSSDPYTLTLHVEDQNDDELTMTVDIVPEGTQVVKRSNSLFDIVFPAGVSSFYEMVVSVRDGYGVTYGTSGLSFGDFTAPSVVDAPSQVNIDDVITIEMSEDIASVGTSSVYGKEVISGTWSIDGSHVTFDPFGYLPVTSDGTGSVLVDIATEDADGNITDGIIQVQTYDNIAPQEVSDLTLTTYEEGIGFGDLQVNFTWYDDIGSGNRTVNIKAYRTIEDMLTDTNSTLLESVDFAHITSHDLILMYDEDPQNPVLSMGRNWHFAVELVDGAGNSTITYDETDGIYFPTPEEAYVEQWYPFEHRVFLNPLELDDLLQGDAAYNIPDFSIELANELYKGNGSPGGSGWDTLFDSPGELAVYLQKDWANDMDPFALHRDIDGGGAVFLYYEGGNTQEGFYDLPPESIDSIDLLLSGFDPADSYTSTGFFPSRTDSKPGEYGGTNEPNLGTDPTWTTLNDIY